MIRFVLTLGLLIPLFTQSAMAKLSPGKLQLAYEAARDGGVAARDAYDSKKKAFVSATVFPLLQSQARAKLPGMLRPYLESGYHIYKVNNTSSGILNLLDTTQTSTPDFFTSFFMKGGLGLPFGFTVEGGLSQVVNDHKATGFYATLSNQVLDLANFVYIDFVPTFVVSATALKVVAGPDTTSIALQGVLGGYHRQTQAQIGFVTQYSTSFMTETSKTVNLQKVRFGFASTSPIAYGLFGRLEVFYPSMSALAMLGYEF